MADNYDRYENEGGGGFMMGLLTGTVLGAGLGMLLAPKAGSELRGALGEQARHLGNVASEQYRKASETAGSWTNRGREERGHEDLSGSYAGTTSGTGAAGTSYGSSTGSSGSSFGSGSGSTGGSFGSGGDFGRS